ncbi:MAG: acyl-CoA synthetase [Alphaproteobacteria bacterium]|nr:acyl-CoA synthetase [Alphaproteobacteria bacterium]
MSPDILHKSDAGGVIVGLDSAEQTAEAVRTMLETPAIRDSTRDGFLIEEMAPPGQEIAIGAIHDSQFGPMIMVGLGGIFVEVLADVAFRLCPITERDARAMLDELRGRALLSGTRGGEAVSEAAIIDALLRIGGEDGLLATHGSVIEGLDINPLIVSADGAVAVDARFILAETTPQEASAHLDDPRAIFKPLFEPEAIAVVGASASSVSIGNTFIDRLRETGFPGAIYPIHPTAETVADLPAYPSLAETPTRVDYAYIAVAANRIPPMLRKAKGRVRFAQVISAGFGEVAAGETLQTELVEAGREGGCRVIGPNCLGLHTPRGRVSFAKNASMTAGSVGIISQSGGLGTDIIRRGQIRGIQYSGLLTVGNSADIGPNDLLEFYLADPATKVIGLYLEDTKDGRRFTQILRRADKPVVILKGGRTKAGQAAAASHTGSLAGDDRVWGTLEKQTGCVLVETLDDFLETLLAFQMLGVRSTRPTQRIVLFGNGGGTSVLATDYFARLGLDIDPLDDTTVATLDALKLPPGTSVINPIDTPVMTLQTDEGRIAEKILDTIYASDEADAVVMHLNLASFQGRGPIDPLDNLIQAAVRTQERYPGKAHFMLVLRSDGEAAIDDIKRKYRIRANDAGIPVYDELANAARALASIQKLERFRHGARRG